MAYQQEDDWRNGLCSHVCGGDCGTCMGAWCCNCFLYGKVGSRIAHFPEENGNMCNADCAIICLAGILGVHCLPVWLKRSDFRKTHRIRGDGCSDCMVAWCCLPCSVAQLNMEVKDRASTARGGPGAGYAQHQAPMAYKPVA